MRGPGASASLPLTPKQRAQSEAAMAIALICEWGANCDVVVARGPSFVTGARRQEA